MFRFSSTRNDRNKYQNVTRFYRNILGTRAPTPRYIIYTCGLVQIFILHESKYRWIFRVSKHVISESRWVYISKPAFHPVTHNCSFQQLVTFVNQQIIFVHFFKPTAIQRNLSTNLYYLHDYPTDSMYFIQFSPRFSLFKHPSVTLQLCFSFVWPTWAITNTQSRTHWIRSSKKAHFRGQKNSFTPRSI